MLVLVGGQLTQGWSGTRLAFGPLGMDRGLLIWISLGLLGRGLWGLCWRQLAGRAGGLLVHRQGLLEWGWVLGCGKLTRWFLLRLLPCVMRS